MSNTRQHPRYSVELACTVAPLSGEPFDAVTKDISAGGICLIAPEDVSLPVGSLVGLALQLVFDEETASEPLELTMKVIWCTPADDAMQIGGKFLELGPEQVDYLAMFLRFLSGAIEVDLS